MILPDSSAWVEYDRRSGGAVDARLDALVRSGDDLAVTEPVIMEVLAGARTDRRLRELKEMLSPFRLLQVYSEDFESAARLYRTCRRVGVTPRGLLDCLIATVAWRHQAAVLTTDADLLRIAGVVGITVDDASLQS